MTSYAKKLAMVAINEFLKFRYMREQEPALAKQIENYWQGIEPFPVWAKLGQLYLSHGVLRKWA